MYPLASRRNRWIFNITTLALFGVLVWTLGVWYGMTVYAVLLLGTWGALWLVRHNLRS
jgi:hypothetical protein